MIIPVLTRVAHESKEIDTQKLKSTLEPCNCSGCGCRIGWQDSDSVADTLVAFCDECATEQEGGDGEEE